MTPCPYFVTHLLRRLSEAYGVFGLGLMAWIYLLALVTLLAAEVTQSDGLRSILRLPGDLIIRWIEFAETRHSPSSACASRANVTSLREVDAAAHVVISSLR